MVIANWEWWFLELVRMSHILTYFVKTESMIVRRDDETLPLSRASRGTGEGKIKGRVSFTDQSIKNLRRHDPVVTCHV